MTNRMRRLEASDLDALVEIYRQAVLTSTDAFYTTAQQSVWASQCEAIRPILQRGQGFVSCNSSNQPMAFCLRDPADRIALLYSHPAMQRSGLGGMLLAACAAGRGAIRGNREKHRARRTIFIKTVASPFVTLARTGQRPVPPPPMARNVAFFTGTSLPAP
mgnify:CR=1 FL=1